MFPRLCRTSFDPKAPGEHVLFAKPSVDVNRPVVAVNVEFQLPLSAVFADDIRFADDLSV